MACVLAIFGPGTFGKGSWFGEVASDGITGGLVCRTWIGGSKGVKACVGSLRWCWDPGRRWLPTGALILVELTRLRSTRVGNSGISTGCCTVTMCLWWRRLLRPTYFLEVCLQWAWLLCVLHGHLFSAIFLAFCCVCCLSRFLYLFLLTDYHLMERHDELYACWCAGCA